MIWDTLSPFYDLFEKIYNGKCFKGIAQEIKNHVNENDVVLECACGTGLLTYPLAEKCKKIFATDFSEGMLRQCKKKTKKFQNIIFEKQSILELPYDDDSFDLVVAANVIHLLDQPEKALSEMKRVCKKNGKIVIPTYVNNEKKNAVVAAKILEKTGVNFKRQFSMESYKEFFKNLSVENVEYKVVEGHMPCCFAIFSNPK